MATRSSDSPIAAIEISPLRPCDRAEWERLARGYKAFYEDPIPDKDYARTWRRLMAGEIQGLGARLDGPMVGIAHYFFHPHCWRGKVCYLQDLFTAVEARGKGVASALVEAIAETARARGRRFLLGHEGGQSARPRALRSAGPVQGLHPLRLSALAPRAQAASRPAIIGIGRAGSSG